VAEAVVATAMNKAMLEEVVALVKRKQKIPVRLKQPRMQSLLLIDEYSMSPMLSLRSQCRREEEEKGRLICHLHEVS
jgi:hypothetical protein